MEELLNRLDITYTSLQSLDIKPTKENTSTILYALITLEKVKDYMSNLPKGDEDGADTEMAEV